jgi:hypothetical protein
MLTLVGSLWFASCQWDEPQVQNDDTHVISYDGTTRVAGTSLEDGDCFTFMSYVKSVGSINPSTYYNNGYYAYDAANSIFVPVNPGIGNSTIGIETVNPIVSDYNYAQHLGQETYYTALIHPAVWTMVARNTTTLGGVMPVMAKITRTMSSKSKLIADNPIESVYVSHATDFEMTVSDNAEKHALPDPLNMELLQSKIRVYFYSSTGVDFEFTNGNNPQLYNAGHIAWYDPVAEKVYPSYNYLYEGNHTTVYTNGLIYSGQESFYTSATYPGYFEVPFDKITGPTDFPPAGAPLPAMGSVPTTGTGEVPYYYQTTEDVIVYPADYSDTSGLVLTLILKANLTIHPNNFKTSAEVPLSINMKRLKTYTIYVDIQSKIMGIYYQVTDWDTKDGGSSEVGGNNGVAYPLCEISYDGDWTPINTGTESIGGN